MHQHAVTRIRNVASARRRVIWLECVEPKREPKPTRNQSLKPSLNYYVTKDSNDDETYGMYNINDQSNEPTRLELSLNDVPIKMIMDTGASLSIISRATYDRIKEHSPSVTLTPSSARLQTYTGQLIPVVGATQLSVRYGSTVASLSIQVVAGEGPDLMGRDWLTRLNVSSGQVNLLEQDQLKAMLEKHEVVLDGNLGCMKDTKVTLQVDDKVKPKFLNEHVLNINKEFLLRGTLNDTRTFHSHAKK